jgi:hypothetical protein
MEETVLAVNQNCQDSWNFSKVKAELCLKRISECVLIPYHRVKKKTTLFVEYGKNLYHGSHVYLSLVPSNVVKNPAQIPMHLILNVH